MILHNLFVHRLVEVLKKSLFQRLYIPKSKRKRSVKTRELYHIKNIFSFVQERLSFQTANSYLEKKRAGYIVLKGLSINMHECTLRSYNVKTNAFFSLLNF